MEILTVGTKIDHPRYGEGMIAKIGLTSYEIFFAHGGKVEILIRNNELTVLEKGSESSSAPIVEAIDLVKVISQVLDHYGVLPAMVEMGKKWEGGVLIMKPANTDMQAKEVPIETFFHKIVMVRDRLRVLEQNINSNDKLTDEDKVNIQQYITRAYGSLTTFNVLFANKEDYFIGAKS